MSAGDNRDAKYPMALTLKKSSAGTMSIDVVGDVVTVVDANPEVPVTLLEAPGFTITLWSEGGTSLLVGYAVSGTAPIEKTPAAVTLDSGQRTLRLEVSKLLGSRALALKPSHIAAKMIEPGLFLEVKVVNEQPDTVTLIAAKDTAAVFDLDLFFSAGQSVEVGVPLQRSAPQKNPLALNFTIVALDEAPLLHWAKEHGATKLEFDFLLSANSAKWKASAEANVVASLEGFAGGDLLSNVVGNAAQVLALNFTFTKSDSLEIKDERLRLAFTTSLMVGAQPLEFDGGWLELGADLNLADGGSATRVGAVLKSEAFLFKDAAAFPLTLHFHKGARILIDFDPRDPSIALVGKETVASAYIPALGDTGPANLETQLKERFVLDFQGEEPTAAGGTPPVFCRITPRGARMTAEARPIAIALGEAITNVQLEKGRMRIDRGDYEIDIEASGQLGYFQKAAGRLGVRASNRNEPQFVARFETQIEAAWEDPTGVIEFRDPSAAILVTLTGSKWGVAGIIGGSLTFKRAPRWLSGAGEWLGELFEKATVRFDGLQLSDLLKSLENAVKLNFQLDDSWNIQLWRILKFDLTDFGLGRNFFEVAGNLHLTLEGGFSFTGSIPRLRVKLEGGVSIDFAKGPLSFSGTLSTPAGIRAKVEFAREQSDERDRIAGLGTISIPGWSDVGVTAGFGKRRVTRGEGPERREKWIGTFFLFVEADIPITLYPGVVLRKIGLGFGINQTLRGFRDIYKNSDGVLALMKDKRGLPNPAKTSEWEDGGTFDSTDLALVARTHIAPSPEGEGPFPYLADAMLYIPPTNDFCLAFTSSLWLFTGMDDVAENDEYRSRPVAQMVIVMYPRHGYFEARARTLRNPKMKAAAAPVAWALSIVETEFWLKATPDLFMLRVGEMRAELKVPGFQLYGSMLYAVRAAGGQVIALMRKELAGGFDIDWSFSLRAGPFYFSLGLEIHARAAYSLLLAGGYLRELGFMFYGRVHFLVSIQMRVRLTVEFSLRIKIGWFKIHIHWGFSASASLSLCFEASAEALVASRGLALQGRGRLIFKVCGYGFSPTIDFKAGDGAKLAEARASLQPLLPQLTAV